MTDIREVDLYQAPGERQSARIPVAPRQAGHDRGPRHSRGLGIGR